MAAALVLCYHSVSKTAGPGGRYSLPAAAFAENLDQLQRFGFTFISGQQFADFLGGAVIRRRAVLVTFDDCYEDLLDTAAPILAARGIPALAFAVTGIASGLNEWDFRLGGSRLRILGPDGLRDLTRFGIEVGAHSRTHPHLLGLSGAALQDEIAGSARDIKAMGLPSPRFFAYPYGEHNAAVREAAAQAGYHAAFDVSRGCFKPGMDRTAVPRVEITGKDGSWRFLAKALLPRTAPRLLVHGGGAGEFSGPPAPGAPGGRL